MVAFLFVASMLGGDMAMLWWFAAPNFMVDIILVTAVGAAVVFGNMLVQRRGRRLPSGLAKAKFVRLG